MKKLFLITPLLVVFSNQIMANEDANMDVSIKHNSFYNNIVITPNVDQLIVKEIIVNRGNCKGWNKEARIADLAKNLQETIKIKEDIKGKYSNEEYIEREANLRKRIAEYEQKIKDVQQNDGVKLVYGETESFTYYCSKGDAREVTVKLADGTVSMFKFR